MRQEEVRAECEREEGTYVVRYGQTKDAIYAFGVPLAFFLVAAVLQEAMIAVGGFIFLFVFSPFLFFSVHKMRDRGVKLAVFGKGIYYVRDDERQFYFEWADIEDVELVKERRPIKGGTKTVYRIEFRSRRYGKRFGRDLEELAVDRDALCEAVERFSGLKVIIKS